MKLISLSSWTRDFNAREWRTKNHETLHEQLDRLDRFAAGGDAPATDAAEATRRLTRTVQRSAPSIPAFGLSADLFRGDA